MSRRTGYEFLDDFELTETQPHTKADWLLNDFNDPLWKISFDHKIPIDLDWGVVLDNGEFLTDPKYSILWASFRHFLIIGTDGPNGEYINLGRTSRFLKFSTTARVIDYLLLNSESFQLRKFGLAGLNRDHMKSMLSQLASTNSAADSIYAWRTRLTAYCAELLSGITRSEAEDIIAQNPSMALVSQEQMDDFDLDINVADIPQIRAALMKAGMYYGNNTAGYVVSSIKISQQIYPQTLRGKQTQKKIGLAIFSFYPSYLRYYREFPRVRVTTGDSEILQDTAYFSYRNTLIYSGVLSSLNLPAPAAEDLGAISDFTPELGQSARFKSIPSDVLLKLFEQGLDFYFEYGRTILDGFIRVARYCDQHQCGFTDINDHLLSKIISEDLRKLGVKRMGLSCHQKALPRGAQRKSAKDLYYQELRANKGLIELVSVCLGIIQFTVGVIMARRIDELVRLSAENCLDETKSWLIFHLEKSTRRARGLRQKEARPIDAIAVELIEELRDFQRLLKRFRFIDKMGTLFAAPSVLGFKGLSSGSLHTYNRNLDFLCDYFETKVTEAGERYYVRQHQLRRFFAIVFFYTNGFGELDTLRWMLGHKDVEQVWRYLTECLGPKDIRGAGARYFTDLAKRDRLENYKDLQELLYAEFGTKMLSMIDEEKIENYLEALMEEGKARIEPHFFRDENGKAMHILFIVSQGK